MLELNIQKRDKAENVDELREKGEIPAVLYGPKEDNALIKLSEREFINIWNEAGGSAIVDLKGVGEDKEVLIHDVSWHPVRNTPIHIDFYCIERGKMLTVTVPLNFIGEAPVEKEGGILVKVMHEIEVEVRPRNIPQSIDVDVTLLTALDSNITIDDLNLPDSIKPTSSDTTENVASVTQAQEEKESEEDREVGDVEIEEKGKEDTEEGGKENEGEKSAGE